MTIKRRRQTAIRELLVSSTGSTQEQIKTDLERQGIAASQATLSRDLREMGAVKVPVDGGGALYKIGGSYKLHEIGNAMRAFAVDCESVSNFLVIHTAPGNAPGFCAVLDRQGWKEIVGTIAGDDTIFIVTRTAKDVAVIEKNLEKSLGKDIQ